MVFSVMSYDTDNRIRTHQRRIPIFVNDKTRQKESDDNGPRAGISGCRGGQMSGATLVLKSGQGDINEDPQSCSSPACLTHSDGELPTCSTPFYVNQEITPVVTLPPPSRLYVNDVSILDIIPRNANQVLYSETRLQGVAQPQNTHFVKQGNALAHGPSNHLPLYLNDGSTAAFDTPSPTHQVSLDASENAEWLYSQPRYSGPRVITGNKSTELPGNNLCGNIKPTDTYLPVRTHCGFNSSIPESPAMAQRQHREDPEIKTYMWFFGDLNRTSAESKLMQRQTDGMYLVRNSSHEDHKYCLSVFYNNKVYHIKIREEGNMFLLGERRQNEPSFSCLEVLITHYQKFPILLSSTRSQRTVLKRSLPK